MTLSLVLGGNVIFMLGMFIDLSRFLRSGGFTGNVTVVSSDNGKSFVYFGRMNWSVFSKLMRDSRDRSLAHELIIPYNYNKRLNR